MNNTGDNKPILKQRKSHHGRNLQFCRELRGIKQPAMAELLGVCTRTMARYESKNELDDTILKKIAEVLNFDIQFMKELTTDSELKVINVNEGGKLFTDSSTNRDKTYEPNSTDESTITHTTNGIPVENYDRVYEMLLAEREKNIRLEYELERLKSQQKE